MSWTKKIPATEITGKITDATVTFAEEFGKYLGSDEPQQSGDKKLTTNQLRKFFGEVKKQQMRGFDKTDFILLKPKLAYAVGRDLKKTKIKDFYIVMADAIDKVDTEEHFRNFIKIFEAIVAYHKATEGQTK